MWKFANSIVETMQRKVEHDASLLSTGDVLVDAVQEQESTRSSSIEEPWLCIYSAHDSTLIGLLCVFQLEQPAAWPEYGSALKIELIREEEEGEKRNINEASCQHWVRFSLNGQLLRSTWCTNDKNEPFSMVPLSDLIEMIHGEHELFEDNENKADDSTALRYSWKAGQLRKH